MTLAARIRAIPSWQITLGGALLVLGFLIAAQIASEGPRVRYTSQERTPLVETALDLQRQQEALKQRILDLRTQIGSLEAAGQGSAALTKELNAQLDQARIAAGLVPLRGHGFVLKLEDSPAAAPGDADAADFLVSGDDVRTVVEELWLAGAEAIAVNGERVSGPTAIVDIGGSVLVNSAYLAPPFDVAAIGPATCSIGFVRARASPTSCNSGRSRSVSRSRSPSPTRSTSRRTPAASPSGTPGRCPARRPDDVPPSREPHRADGGLRHPRLPRRGPAEVAGVGARTDRGVRAGADGPRRQPIDAQRSAPRRDLHARGEATVLTQGRIRGDSSIDAVRSDLARVQAWIGLAPVRGPGVEVTVAGPSPVAASRT